ncbi:MAG: HAMP domain-containing histidine kinase [Alphaproteobacteria bacterium]|nr:HAMP domain-containing histidine kinase [Alphaproteobacteria bacterium]
MPYSVTAMPFAAAIPERLPRPSEQDMATRSLKARIDAIFQVHAQIGAGNAVLGLVILAMLSPEVATTTRLFFVSGILLLASARLGLFLLYRRRWGGLSPISFTWAAAGISFATGIVWTGLFRDTYNSSVSWDLVIGILGIGLTSFTSVLMGIWLPAALAFPLATSLGVSLVYLTHWTPFSPGLMALTWVSFAMIAILAHTIGRSALAELELRLRLTANESRFRLIAEANPIPSAVIRRKDSSFLFANSRLADLLGLKADELLSSKLWNIVARREDRDALTNELRRLDLVENHEVILSPRPGRHLLTHLSLLPLEIEGEEMLMLTVRDVTQDKELQKAQVAARLAAESALTTERRAVEEQRHFLAMVAHEFRTPLSIISTTLDVLDMTADTQSPEKELAFKRIRRATERLVRLIETCLNEDRLGEIGGSLTREPFNLTSLVHKVVQDSRGGSNAPRIEAILHESPLTVTGDKALIKIALANLVDNAEKYTKTDGQVTLRLTPYGDQAVVQVADSGMGIPDSELPRIFDKYYRAPGAKGIAGAGLGLHLVKRIIELHGGRIEAASVLGQGSTFTVRLPLVSGIESGEAPQAD